MLNKLLIILVLLSQCDFFLAQDIPVGDWRDHLPYSDAVSVSYGNNIVYCATNSAVFTYDKTDQIVSRLSLVNGLSDVGLSKIKFNDYNNRVIITYTNGNIDVINENKEIINLSFVKNSNIVGSKTINHIYIVGKLAYLSTGFGIVVLDTDKLEITETYLYGPLGGYVMTNAVTMDSTNIYAATDQGVFYANKNSTNLVDYNVWSFLPDLGTFNYSDIITYANRVFTSLDNFAFNGDTVFYNDAGIWQKFIPNGVNINSLNVSRDYMFISHSASMEKYDTSLTAVKTITHHKQQFGVYPNEAIMDDEGYILIAENSHGILRVKDNWTGDIISPNSPSSSNVFNMDFKNDELWVVSGGFGLAITENVFNNRKADGTWENFSATINDVSGSSPASDMVAVAIDPQNTSHVYVGSFDDGLFELNNGVVTNILTAQNSILDSVFFGITAVAAMQFDDDNNFWVSSSYTTDILAVKTPQNDWYSFSFPGQIAANEFFPQMIIDQNNFKWLISPEANGVLVFDDNGTLADKTDDRSKVLKDESAPFGNPLIINADIPGAKIQCIEEDLDGEIWIGTDEGVAVFYNPSAVFDEDIKAEQIFIQQDGQTQILFETEIVTVIKVDGANRKWIGTQTSGVYLMSDDGTEQVEHFTTENSPLLSNSVFEIVINPKTGEVFFGTSKGIISYKGTATEANDDFNNVFVYPNPVKPDFNGTIAIRGLVADTDVRITDISGNIVYQTTSLGGQAVWDGKDFNGNKVQTGVYMVFNGSPEGNLKAAAKILFIN